MKIIEKIKNLFKEKTNKLGIKSNSNGRIEIVKEKFFKRKDVQMEIDNVKKSRNNDK